MIFMSDLQSNTLSLIQNQTVSFDMGVLVICEYYWYEQFQCADDTQEGEILLLIIISLIIISLTSLCSFILICI